MTSAGSASRDGGSTQPQLGVTSGVIDTRRWMEKARGGDGVGGGVPRFLHYYTRYKNHDNARRVEFPLLTSVHHKRNLLQASLIGDMGNTVLKKGNTVDTQFY